MGDGNCLMRWIALFKFKDELKHNKVRKDIVNYLKLHINEFQKIEIDTEIGSLNINNYINYISKLGTWGEELEKYAAEELYNINIIDYRLNVDNLNNPLYYQYIYFLNQDKNYKKDLCILTYCIIIIIINY